MYEKISNEEGLLDIESPFNWDGILLSDLGTKEQKITSGSLNELSTQNVGTIHCMVIPANFSEMEKEAFNRRRIVE
jgi:diphthamide biosynthesis methyltransferase